MVIILCFYVYLVNCDSLCIFIPIIPAGSTPITLANDAIGMLPDNIDKTLMIYQNSLKKQYTY